MAYTEPRSYTFVNKDEPNGALDQNKIFAADLNTLVGNSRDANTRVGSLERGVLAPVTVTYAASLTINATTGARFEVTATGDLTIADITGGVDGQSIELVVKASGGTRTLTVAGTSVSLPNGSRWWGRLLYDLTDDTWTLDDGSGGGANSTDAELRDRSTHTGTQPISTVTNLQATLDAKVAAVTTGAKLWIGTQAAYDAIGTKDATTLYAITS